MVSPSTSPEKPSKPKFPLFNRLLHESLSGRVPARNGNYPECPATAPVLLCSSKTSIDDMAKETVHKEIKMAHEIHLKNNKYRQWVKAGLGLGYLKEGLAPFCDDIGRQQHNDIINQIQQTKTPQPNIPCGACQITTLQPDHVRVSKGICPLKQDKCNCCFPNNNLPCPNNVCGAIYDSIIQSHASMPPAPFWKNSDVRQWSTEPWEVCKCFINAPGYKDKTSAVDTDCTGLLHVIINNNYFHSHIGCNVTGPNNLFSKVTRFVYYNYYTPKNEVWGGVYRSHPVVGRSVGRSDGPDVRCIFLVRSIT
ncbi:uncharacterized protein LOC132739690 isoform X1 [Ruditapes philippinarum]|uniref:uncharacterized protein LOC132739690 isoform X1 n=1 Tax=Ruditapes philippinarum TaxID=129788 RepID=UPI00295B37C2|nr:uncharacterized protein LOC132739690 isoform X1 [Ruditapes philippinarum]